MRTFLAGIALCCTLALSAGKRADKVYVCDSSSSIAYHNSSTCRGLNRCAHRIIQVSESDAVQVYRNRKCRICY